MKKSREKNENRRVGIDRAVELNGMVHMGYAKVEWRQKDKLHETKTRGRAEEKGENGGAEDQLFRQRANQVVPQAPNIKQFHAYVLLKRRPGYRAGAVPQRVTFLLVLEIK